MHGLILSELARLSISTECIVYWASAGQTGVSWREWLVTECWWTDGVIGDRKRRHLQVTTKWAEAELCPRTISRPSWGSRRWSPRPRRSRPPASRTRSGSGLHSRYPYIDTQTCYSLINSRLLTVLFESDRQMESRKFIPRCWNLCVYNVQ